MVHPLSEQGNYVMCGHVAPSLPGINPAAGGACFPLR